MHVPSGSVRSFRPLASAVALAIREAQSAVGRTSPNPPVGAVVVRDGVIIGSGATQPPGGPHAEIVALRMAGAAAQGADLYTTLEPCTFHGRTPPCTTAIRHAGIRRVCYIARDPDPRIGDGAACNLQAAGIEVVRLPDPHGVVADLLAPFHCRVTTGRPLVTAKYAMTLDGRIATATGDSRWISGSAARREVHRLRDRVDAIMVGVGTVLADDPQLTTRLDDHWRSVRHPLRVIVDTHGRTPLTAQILNSELPGRTLIATVAPAADWAVGVRARGGELLVMPADPTGRVDLTALLRTLAQRGHNHVLVEGGAALLGALSTADVLDEVWAFIAPKLVGSAAAPGPLAGVGVARMADAAAYTVRRVANYAEDTLIVATAAHAPWWQTTVEEEDNVHGDC